jgi:carboxymethylenebutenolidase
VGFTRKAVTQWVRDMRAIEKMKRALFGVMLALSCASAAAQVGETVSFSSGDKVLHGLVYRPSGSGPFPAVLYNHGSAPGMLSKQAFDALGPVFVSHGWVLFGPFRRGQGLSAAAGPFIGDQMDAAGKKGGPAARAAEAVRLLETDHLNDQLAALEWLRQQSFVQKNRIAVAGTSFGGIEVVLGAERGDYCAAVDTAGGAQTWARSPLLQSVMIHAVQNSKIPIFFFQAANDYDLQPSKILSAVMKDAGRPYQLKIYPAYGNSIEDGHAFGYFGATIWADDVLRFLNENCRAHTAR